MPLSFRVCLFVCLFALGMGGGGEGGGRTLSGPIITDLAIACMITFSADMFFSCFMVGKASIPYWSGRAVDLQLRSRAYRIVSVQLPNALCPFVKCKSKEPTRYFNDDF